MRHTQWRMEQTGSCFASFVSSWGGGGTANGDRDKDGRPCAKVRGEQGHDTKEKVEELEGDLGG